MAEQKQTALTDVDSDYRLVILAALRSKQLQRGAPQKGQSRFTKPTRIALDEVRKKLVEYVIVPPKKHSSEE